MSVRVVNRGDSKYRKPRTCKQTGNRAPRFPWPAAVRVAIHCMAHHLDYTDSQMCVEGEFPKEAELYSIFQKTLPWFEEYYNASQIKSSIAKGYPLEKLNPFGPSKPWGRLYYEFSEPGKTGGKKRRYGISKEHPDNPAAKRRAVREVCSDEIMRRLKFGETISKEEIDEWSKAK